MQFPFPARRVLGGGSITRIDGNTIESNRGKYSKELRELITAMGNASAAAQGLGSVITTASKMEASDHVLYIASDDRRVLGFIKVGFKKLFISGKMGNLTEMFPLCVLDFYVHEDCQRQGIGFNLFEFMRKDQNDIPPSCLAYDRPSPKFLSFLKKHCGLTDYVPQNNNFVVFSDHPALKGEADGARKYGSPFAHPGHRSAFAKLTPSSISSRGSPETKPYMSSSRAAYVAHSSGLNQPRSGGGFDAKRDSTFSTPKDSPGNMASPSCSVYYTSSAARRVQKNSSSNIASLLSPSLH